MLQSKVSVSLPADVLWDSWPNPKGRLQGQEKLWWWLSLRKVTLMITHIGGQKPYYSVLYSSGRSHSNFWNIQLCSFEKLGRPNLFWTWKEFPPWNFNRLRRNRNWKWLELFYLSVLCLFVCFYLRSLKNVQCYLHFLNKESVVWMKTYNFFLPSCNGQSCMGPDLFFFCGAISSTCDGIH